MIYKNEILILGAGASKPYGFPLGSELRDTVVQINEDASALDLLDSCGFHQPQLQDFTQALRFSGCGSVDAFLEENSSYLDIGKACMALVLLRAEISAKTTLFPPAQPQDHWYQKLWEILKRETYDEFRSQQILLVTFNYDRSLEHFLATVASNRYRIESDQAARLLPIIHVHGQLGEYKSDHFGMNFTTETLQEAIKSIHVVHESIVGHSEFSFVRSRLMASERVLFIGFGYLRANLKKLGLVGDRMARDQAPEILGTHLGHSDYNWGQLCSLYRFSKGAEKHGGGSTSEFIENFLI